MQDPSHPIVITANPKRVTVAVNGTPVATTAHALTLREASYPPVQYIPREDVAPGVLAESSHTTYCPHKGEARYFHIDSGGVRLENAVWSYETPKPAAAMIRGHVAFYPNKASITEGG